MIFSLLLNMRSHPVWVCGLKLALLWGISKGRIVTPCMGVWIETQGIQRESENTSVTPCMGVWIETYVRSCWRNSDDVTPCMGVWIETLVHIHVDARRLSHPVWVCGLKLYEDMYLSRGKAVTPCMGVWIETRNKRYFRRGVIVTPCMGVWIET